MSISDGVCMYVCAVVWIARLRVPLVHYFNIIVLAFLRGAEGGREGGVGFTGAGPSVGGRYVGPCSGRVGGRPNAVC